MTKILVVDDDPMPRLIFKTLFEQDDYEIIEANDAIEGLQLAELQLPQLIITDMMMARMTGIEFLRKLKENPAVKHIPVIVSSAKKSLEDMKLCLKAGAVEYVPKPVDLIVFRKRVKEILGHHGA